MAKFLVTGGAGFIGSNLVEALLREEHAVRVFDNLSTGKRENLAAFAKDVEVVEADLRNQAAVQGAMKGVDFCLHHAALATVTRSVRDPYSTNDVNVTGTLNVLLAARDCGVKRVVFASSSSVYGASRLSPKSETHTPEPISPYATSKLAGELYARNFHQLFGTEIVCLRYFNVFGPRQDPQSEYAAVIPRFISTMLAKQAPVIYGDGEQSRDFCFIENVIQANLLACKSEDACAGEAINISCGDRISINQLAQKLNALLGTNIQPKHEPPRPGDVLHSQADISKAQKLLGYIPKVKFDEGLRRTVEWYKRDLA